MPSPASLRRGIIVRVLELMPSATIKDVVLGPGSEAGRTRDGHGTIPIKMMVQRVIALASLAYSITDRPQPRPRIRFESLSREAEFGLPKKMLLFIISRAFRSQSRYPLLRKPPFFLSSTEKQRAR